MRVLFVTGEYPVMQGGVGDYTHRLGQALGVLGAEVHVLTHVDAGGDHLRAPDGHPRAGGLPTPGEAWVEPVAAGAAHDRRGEA